MVRRPATWVVRLAKVGPWDHHGPWCRLVGPALGRVRERVVLRTRLPVSLRPEIPGGVVGRPLRAGVKERLYVQWRRRVG